MKKVFLSLALLLVVALYSNGCKSPSGRITQPAIAVSDNASQQEELISRVNEIYSTVFDWYAAWDAKWMNDEPVSEDFYINFDSIYCSQDWNSVKNKVLKYDATLDEVGFFEADYWVMGQDFHDLSISDVEVIYLQGNKAQVEFNLHNCGAVSRVRLDMVKEDGEWKIDDFIDVDNDYGDIYWKKEMNVYLKENAASMAH